MATTKELEQQVAEMRRLLANHGILPPEPEADVTERLDYVEFGSARHAALLGLVEVDDPEAERADGYIVHTSRETGRHFRLEDQVTPFMHVPDPAQVAKLVLMQKVSVLETGKPPVPKNAPPLWNPNTR